MTLNFETQPNLSVTVSASDPTATAVVSSTSVSTAYTLAVTEAPITADKPVTAEDTSLFLSEEVLGSFSLELLDGQPQAVHGTISGSVEVIRDELGNPVTYINTLTYTPDANFHGLDIISGYTIAGEDQTVEVLVTPVNDAPTLSSPVIF